MCANLLKPTGDCVCFDDGDDIFQCMSHPKSSEFCTQQTDNAKCKHLLIFSKVGRGGFSRQIQLSVKVVLWNWT